MEDHPEVHIKLDGELIAELLDQSEYHSNIGSVAAISTRQICLLRRLTHELVPFKLEYFDTQDCRAIDYQKDTAYYRIVVAAASFIAAAIIAFMLAANSDGISVESGPFIVAAIGLVTFGIRFSTSIYRHIIHFEMPEETLTWRSPAIDFRFKAEAAHDVRDYARKRGILREAAA